MRITKKIKEQMIAILEEVYRDTKPALIFLDALREHLLGRDNVQVYL